MPKEFITPGEVLLCRGERKTVKKWDGKWSMSLRTFPHRIFILWEGETKYEKFVSDTSGSFHELDRPE